MAKIQNDGVVGCFGYLIFGIWYCFGFRYSDLIAPKLNKTEKYTTGNQGYSYSKASVRRTDSAVRRLNPGSDRISSKSADRIFFMVL